MAMRFKGAVIYEQGRTIALVSVKKQVMEDPAEAERTLATFAPLFPGVAVVLTAQDGNGSAVYYGDAELARLLAGVPARAIPLRDYTIADPA